MTYLGPISIEVLNQCAELEKDATRFKDQGDWTGAIATLRHVKALHGDLYQSTRLAKFLQQGGCFDEALIEIQWLADHAQVWAKAMFGHQPVSIAQRQKVSWLTRLYKDGALICKREKRPDLQLSFEKRSADFAELLSKVRPVAEEDAKVRAAKRKAIIDARQERLRKHKASLAKGK